MTDPVALTPAAFARHTVVLIGLAVATQIASLAVGWFDERYLVDSVLCGGVMIYFLIDLMGEHRRHPLRGAT